VCLSVCLSVFCLFVCLLTSETTHPNFTKFSVHVTRGYGSVLLRRPCDMLSASGFVDDVFSHTAKNRPQSKTTREFRPVRQVLAPFERRTTLLTLFGRYRHLAVPEAKSAVSTASCSVLSHKLSISNFLLLCFICLTVSCCNIQ